MKTDILSDVLQGVRLSGAIFFDVQTSTPWVAQAPPSSEIADRVMPGSQHVIEYHVVISGRGWGGLSDDPQSLDEFGPGSILVFPQGDSHMMSSDPRLRTDPDLGIFEEMEGGAKLPFYLTHGGGGPDGTRLICGFLGCDIRPFNPLLQALPRMIHVRNALAADGGWLGQLIEATLKESSERRLGGGGILTKLSELIFIEVVRRHAESPEQTAASVGYDSESSFSRAFKRATGSAPTEWRKKG